MLKDVKKQLGIKSPLGALSKKTRSTRLTNLKKDAFYESSLIGKPSKYELESLSTIP